MRNVSENEAIETIRANAPSDKRLGLGHKMISSRRMMKKTSSKRRMESTTSSQSPTGSPTRKVVRVGRRRVHFELDDKERIKRHVRSIENCKYFNEKDVSVRWWSRDELSEILEREQNVFEVFSNCCASYVDGILRLWDQCKRSAEDENALLSDDILKITNAAARGMESDVVMTHIPGSREKAIKCVIETQRNMSRANPRIRANTMSRRYKHLSRTATKFALSIANGDAIVAQNLNK